MTREQRDELAHVCAELTDNLPYKLKRIGEALAERMSEANCWRRRGGDLAEQRAEGAIDGILAALARMGIPYEAPRRECGDYVAVKIAGETFYASAETGKEETQ